MFSQVAMTLEVINLPTKNCLRNGLHRLLVAHDLPLFKMMQFKVLRV